jgi:hypothetical protein
MDLSEDLKQANKLADETAEKHDARARKHDRDVEAFVDARVDELDRAAENVKAAVSERKKKA